jgi:radical SAM protein with 4Fe4S-binding SPASM domain
MITASPTFCPCPWTTLNIDQTGTVKPCLSSYEYKQDLGNINTSTVQEIIAGPRLQELKQRIAAGAWDPVCGGCQRSEAAGSTSARQLARADTAVLEAIDRDPTWFSLRDLTVNWTNLCNLTCTYCNPETSTAWQAVRGLPIGLVRNQHADLIALAREHSASLKGVTLGGGEPLLQRGLLEFLQALEPEHTQVMITTNLSMKLEHNAIYHELKRWPRVTWMISFDNASADRFEYVRRGCSWTQFVANIEQLQADQQQVVAHPAYSVYCAGDLRVYYDFCDQYRLPIYWCDLSDPAALDARRLPLEHRLAAQAEIDCILEQYRDHPRSSELSLETLARYRNQLESEWLAHQPERDVATPAAWHQEQEQIQAHPYRFCDLWPEYCA